MDKWAWWYDVSVYKDTNNGKDVADIINIKEGSRKVSKAERELSCYPLIKSRLKLT